MRMAVDGVAAHDQTRDLVRAELDGWQGRCCILGFSSGGNCQAGQSRDPCRLLQEVAATGRGAHAHRLQLSEGGAAHG